MESSTANENQIYLESNELNKLMETLMVQITTNKPQDIVRLCILYHISFFRLASWQVTCDSSMVTESLVRPAPILFTWRLIEADRRQFELLKTEVSRLEVLVNVRSCISI